MITLLKKYLAEYKLQIILVVIFALIESMGQAYLPRVFKNIITEGVAKNNLNYVWRSGAGMLAITFAIAVCMVISSYLSAYVTAAFTSKVRGDMFKKIQRFTELDFLRFNKEALLARTTTDTTQMQIVMINLLRSVLTVPFLGIFALVNCFMLNAPLTLFILAGFAVSIFFASYSTEKSLALFEKLQYSINRISVLTNEKLTGARAIRAFNRQNHELEKLTAANDDALDKAIAANKCVAYLFPLMQLLMNFAIVCILFFGSLQLQYKLADISTMLVFIQYCLMISTSLVVISLIINAVPKARVSAKLVNEVLDYEPVIKEPAYIKNVENPRGEIVFDQVHFGYMGAQELVLRDISFTVRPGETTAIVGATGSGKSTLIKLMLRFFDVNYYGAIKIDGIDIRDMSINKLRAMTSYAPQKPSVFKGTLLSNLRVANPEITEDMAREICDIAQVTEILTGKNETVNMEVSQGGQNLSGGQRQRVSLARAFAKDATIYLLDDSLSALDFKTDSRIRKAMESALRDKTVLIVAQRLSTIMNADQIIVLENGMIAGKGTHNQLLKECDVYRQTYETQAYQAKGGLTVG